MARKKKELAVADKPQTLADKYDKSFINAVKKRIEDQRLAWQGNYDTFDRMYTLVMRSAITDGERAALLDLHMPAVQCNILNSPISRLCGEYSKQEPALYVYPETSEPLQEGLTALIEMHIKAILNRAQKSNTQYRLYQDCLVGGFSVAEVFTKYKNNRTFQQEIDFRRHYRPTFCGFDLMAQELTKKDANWYYCFIPMTQQDFINTYPEADLSKYGFVLPEHMQGKYEWNYLMNDEKVITVCHYYYKKYKKATLLRLAEGQEIFEDEYKRFVKMMEAEGAIEQIPEKVEEREVMQPYFCRLEMTSEEVLKEQDTTFSEPNLVYFDGDSAWVQAYKKDALEKAQPVKDSYCIQQWTKPYVWHALGLQKMVNLSAQTIAAHIQNSNKANMMVAEESLPTQDDWKEKLLDNQSPGNKIWKSQSVVQTQQGEQTIQNPPPAPVPIAQLPPDAEQIFFNCMQMLQNILGSYDAALGIQNNEVSGVAIVEAATQSNSAAMPFVVNNMVGMTQVGRVIMSQFPYLYQRPMSIPYLDKESDKGVQHMPINGPGQIRFKFNPEDLGLTIEAGPSFAVEKNRALKAIIQLMDVSPVFAQFINSKGLKTLLDNVDFYGVDVLKKEAEAFMQEMQEQQQQMQQQQQQAAANNPQVIRAQVEQERLAMEKQQQPIDNAIAMAKIDQEKQQAQNELIIEFMKFMEDKKNNETKMATTMMESARKSRDQEHQEIKDIMELKMQNAQIELKNEQNMLKQAQ